MLRFRPWTDGEISVAQMWKMLIPETWSWAFNDAFYHKHATFFATVAILYYPIIFGVKYLMENRAAGFDLGGAKSKSFINWIFWWEAGLSLFSIIGATIIVPIVLEPVLLHGQTLAQAICRPNADEGHMGDDPRAFWLFLFNVSKVFEFGDTLFIVLRKKKLVMIQHYHHLTTMLFCWYVSRVFEYSNAPAFFGAMNFAVHSVMYTWYAAARTGWRSPKFLMIFITFLQIAQMVGGIYITIIAAFGSESQGCGRWLHREARGVAGALFMYASYFVLFARLFYDSYLMPTKEKALKTE